MLNQSYLLFESQQIFYLVQILMTFNENVIKSNETLMKIYEHSMKIHES